MGLTTAGATPVAYRTNYYNGQSYPLYRVSDLRPKHQIATSEPKILDVLLATSAANDAAKRYRDTAKMQYAGQRFGLATWASEKGSTL